MIDNNSKMFLPMHHENINMAVSNIKANQEVISEVEKILKSLDSIEVV